MKVHSLTILHYGADYLPYALRSVYDNVDQCHIFYTPTPSHGHGTNVPPVETWDQLRQAAYTYDPDQKIRWYDVTGVTQEGPHRDMALKTVAEAGAELVLVVDCDEIWADGVLGEVLPYLYEDGKARENLINMTHLWRSFNWACNDNAWPVRVIDLRHQYGTFYIPQRFDVFHFGYAIRNEIMTYKWRIHGHKNEMRQGWLGDKWNKWPPPDNCHPTNGRNESGVPFWSPHMFDKTKLPEFMRKHPFYGLDRID